MTPDFQTSVVFKANYKSTADVIVNQGGTSSGKTYAILQVLFIRAAKTPNLTITIAGQDIPNLKVGALRDAHDIVNASAAFKSLIATYNISERTYTFRNGSIIEFKSYKDAQDAKSGKRDYLFVNEANGVKPDVYFELAIRTRLQIYLDYNPNAEFWVHEQLIGQTGTQLIISDHRHNPFISQAMHDKIEGIKDKDKELWDVYARGKTGKIEGLVFRNWDTVEAVPDHAQLVGYGLDFGFTNDPTAYIGMWKGDGELYLRELVYETNLTNPQIAERIKPYNERFCIADCSEPKSIKELRDNGVKVLEAKKGPDSVVNGIDILKRYKLHITRDSPNLRKELLAYKWKQDKNGKHINEPVDFMNHLMDAMRYVALNNFNLNYGKYNITGIGPQPGRR